MQHARAGLVLFAAVLAVVFAAASPVAAAPTKSRIAVLPLDVDGEVETHWKQTLETSVVDALVRGQFIVVRPGEVRQGDAGAKPCAEAACWSAIGKESDSSYLVGTSVRKRDRDWEMTLVVVWAQDGSVVASKEARCEICGVGEVAQRLADELASVVDKLQDLSAGAAVLAITTSPTGATVTIDGDPVGTTPIERELVPGQHLVEVELAGHIVEKRRIVTAKGVREQLRMALDPLPRGRPFAIAGWVGVGLGVAAFAGGVTLLVLDERPYKANCTGANVDVNGTCRKRYDTLLGGAILTGVGVAVLGTGIGLLVASRRTRARSRDRAQRHARFAVSRDGVLLQF